LSKKGGQDIGRRIKDLEKAKGRLQERLRGPHREEIENHWRRQIEGIDKQLERLRKRRAR
jgi:hypothetical protein